MKNIVLGAVVLVWGVAVLVYNLLLREAPVDTGTAYARGGQFALVLAVVMVAIGGRALAKGLHARG